MNNQTDTGVSVYGEYSEYVRSHGGEPLSYEEWIISVKGEDGATWLTGEGEPASASGADGDLYLDKTTCNVYCKTDGVWELIVNIKGEDGESGADDAGKWISGQGEPSDDCGNNGDWYVDITVLNVYLKSEDSWTLVGKINGADASDGYEEEYVTVTFDSVVGEPYEEQIVKGETLELPCPENDGKIFLGWYCGEGANVCRVTPLTPIVCDVTLTAKWAVQPKFTFSDLQTRFVSGKTCDISGIYTGEPTAAMEITLTVSDENKSLREAEKSGYLRVEECEIYRTGDVCAVDVQVTFLRDGEYIWQIAFDEGGIKVDASRALTVGGFDGTIEFKGGYLCSSDSDKITADGVVTCYSYEDGAVLEFCAPRTATAKVYLGTNLYENFSTGYDDGEDIYTVIVNAADMGEINALKVTLSDDKYGELSVCFTLIIDDISAIETLQVHSCSAVAREAQGGTAAFSYTVVDAGIADSGEGEFYIVANSKIYSTEYSGEFGSVVLSSVGFNQNLATVEGCVNLNDGASVTFSLVYESACGEKLYFEDTITVSRSREAEWRTGFSESIIYANEQIVFTATIDCALSKVIVSIDEYELTKDAFTAVGDCGQAKYTLSVSEGSTTVAVTFSLEARDADYVLIIRDFDGNADGCTEYIIVESEDAAGEF
ncbi:MAG: InlB B-repeat-containing protein [Candidatus Coproplasma sp.]